MKAFKIAALSALLMLGSIAAAFAQGGPSQPAVTSPSPKLITTGNTFQALLPAVLPSTGQRRSLTIQNNNASDSCQLLIGGPWQAGDTTASTRTVAGVSITAAKGAIVLLPGGTYARYFPYVPSDQILATCSTTGDSIYVDTQ